MTRLLAMVLLFGFAWPASALETNGIAESIRFETSVSPPVYKPPARLQKYDKLFRVGLNTLPEGMLVWGALTLGGADFRLSEAQSSDLKSLLEKTYTQMNADPLFAKLPSALPYCLSTVKQTKGHYFLYRPRELPEDPVVIVFLHGYGGNFKFYTWVLKEAFPDAIILAPSWGAAWNKGSSAYLRDAVTDAQKRLGIVIRKPWLFAISAGGRGGFRICGQHGGSFRGYVCLASAPEAHLVPRLPSDLNILMLNGTEDRMVPIERARARAAMARDRVPALQFRRVEGNHFFLLGNREKTFKIIKEFMRRTE